MWIIYSIVLHALLLGSIFVIYFRSPVITNLQPQPHLRLKGPAKRLVLFITDGLRAESFFHNNFEHIPHLKELIKKTNSIIGISHTRIPTESRPGHIALIAGLYEDPSAVTRGWKENPIEFDTVFNRSRKTYAWGANDVLHIFSRLTKNDEQRLFFDSYSHELDFSGKEKTYELDQWVFERVEMVLKRKADELKKEEKVIFFLHLLGLDTAGHVHKPGTEKFIENLKYTEKGIKHMYDLFESTFPDNKTAYILTSDHGMTNAGSHGAGEKHETETPFFMWGAGIAANRYDEKYSLNLPMGDYQPIFHLEQAQIAPLMSALLGIAVPMNNYGILPFEFLDASMEYKYLATKNNALQLVEQYRTLLKQHKQGLLTPLLPKYDLLYNNILDGVQQLVRFGEFSSALIELVDLMNDTRNGISYYFNYYRVPLLAATSLTYVGFIAHLLKLLNKSNGRDVSDGTSKERHEVKTWHYVIVIVAALLTSGFCILQKVPWSISVYLLLPVLVWYKFMKEQKGHLRSALNLTQLVLLAACSEMLVYTFFERKAISAGFLLFTLYEAINKDFSVFRLEKVLKLFFTLTLCAFPLLPPSVGYSNNLLLYIGITLTALRPFVVNARVPFNDRVVVFVTLVNAIVCIHCHTEQWGVPLVSQYISWLFLFYVVASLIWPSSCLSVKHRLERFIFLLTSLYCLLCTSYESLFVLLLVSALTSSVVDSNQTSLTKSTSESGEISNSFQYAFDMLLYTFFSFFGSGNIASVSSFDPNIIRCFLTTFSPFVIMFLVILKLIVPILLITSIIFGMSALSAEQEKQVFICLLILCDVMGLNFLFLVRNHGSWLDIGTSISHFVIMNVTTVVLMTFVYLSKFLLRINISAGKSNLKSHNNKII